MYSNRTNHEKYENASSFVKQTRNCLHEREFKVYKEEHSGAFTVKIV